MISDELNETVAEKLGWTLCDDEPNRKEWHSPQNPGVRTNVIPNYSNSIEAVWEIVDKVQAEGRRIQIVYNPPQKLWVVMIGKKDGSEEVVGQAVSGFLPLALCCALISLRN